MVGTFFLWFACSCIVPLMFLLDRGQVILVGGGEDGSVSAILAVNLFCFETLLVLRLLCGMFLSMPSDLEPRALKFFQIYG